MSIMTIHLIQAIIIEDEFIDSLKVNVKDINTEEKCIIETPICFGDGLGIQTDVSA